MSNSSPALEIRTAQALITSPATPLSSTQEQLLSPNSQLQSAELNPPVRPPTRGEQVWNAVKKGAVKSYEVGEAIGGWVAWLVGIEDNHFEDELTDRLYHDMVEKQEKTESGAELENIEHGNVLATESPGVESSGVNSLGVASPISNQEETQ
jgi:hypothetical protein